MGRSSTNAKVWHKNMAKCLAQQPMTIRPNFGKNLASFLLLSICSILILPLTLTGSHCTGYLDG